MAGGAKKSALALLAPNAIKTVVDGQDIVVATDKNENDALNMIVAAQMRNLIQENIKKYKDTGAVLTPKELKELAEAARNVAEFSGEIYKAANPVGQNTPESKEKATAEEDISEVDFGGLGSAVNVTPPDKK